MSITYLQSRAHGLLGGWLVEVSSDLTNPTFYWYMDGELRAITREGRYVFPVAEGESAEIEVLDDANSAPQPVFPGRIDLEWAPVTAGAAVDYYRVDEYVGAVWTERARVKHVAGAHYYTYRTRLLEDQTTHQFRIVPVGVNGNEGTAATMSFPVVRRPDPPELSMSYNPATRTVTFSDNSA